MDEKAADGVDVTTVQAEYNAASQALSSAGVGKPVTGSKLHSPPPRPT
jgi:hypothetical protein